MKLKILWRLIALLLAPVGFLCGAESGPFGSFPLPQGFSRVELMVDGVNREALIYAPSGAGPTSCPVVFVFHGHGGSSRQVARSLAISREWPEAISVYMQGLPTPGQLTDPDGLRAEKNRA